MYIDIYTKFHFVLWNVYKVSFINNLRNTTKNIKYNVEKMTQDYKILEQKILL
jgi:hypothetical protein